METGMTGEPAALLGLRASPMIESRSQTGQRRMMIHNPPLLLSRAMNPLRTVASASNYYLFAHKKIVQHNADHVYTVRSGRLQ